MRNCHSGKMLPRVHTAIYGVLVVALLGACTSADDDSPADPNDRLAAAASLLADAPSLEISLVTERLPDGQTGLLSATGVGDYSPAFEGDVVVTTGGLSIPSEVIAVDDEVWASTGFSDGYLILDPASLQAPDPARLLGTGSSDGLPGLLSQGVEVETEGRIRDGSDVLTEITATIAGTDIAALLPTADPDGTFEISYRLTDADEFRSAVVSGPFYQDSADVTYTLTMTASDAALSITAPEASGTG